ncbi:HlyD family efflux transporter periplasmic adaptor subunit [Candidatus Ruthia endofausta]|uniref:HlyD family efflux transporter periplasmic adaptor subunit n=1 Tax=Candidatus Ruthia endofausta TaxID=2738852 RepID=A0A6N0HN44_9GAMM|nr:HlyD family efflux transporter periplasmic adaptor subunit [Candidatus Ruthia endofausta]QKQ23746.1 HlyD family efflux transporter periplasmic adaptor subunit [Candidatus Ruthia endofausta]
MNLEKILLKVEHSFSIVYVLLGGFIAFILWASLFDIDETVRCQGKVVANSSSQIIQVVDGGVLSKLLVSEGEHVKQRQLLATLEKDRAQASYYEVRSQVAYLKSALARANAEILENPIVFDELTQDYPDFMSAQKALYVQKKRSLNQEVSMLEESLAMSTKEWEITQSLEKTGDVSQLEVLRAKQKVLDFKRKVADTKNKYYGKISAEIEKLEGELAKNLYKLKKQKSVLEYTDIYSPVSGIVKELKVTTVGGVLRAGEQLMEISPSQGGVILEAKINPVDIGRLKLGMPVVIKLDAFDYTIFGGLKGTLNYISSDTLLDKDSSGGQMTFYQVNVKIEGPEHEDNVKSKAINVKLGMSGTIDIKVGRRSLFTYLTKPISRGFSGALNEK